MLKTHYVQSHHLKSDRPQDVAYILRNCMSQQRARQSSMDLKARLC